jgi:uncharacterized protein (TIGR00369 family)
MSLPEHFEGYDEGVGEWTGWVTDGTDPYERQSGPFFSRRDSDGKMRCAFRVGVNHLNSSRVVHGGCLVTFADYALFSIARQETKGALAVTVSFNSEFLNTAHEGELLEATGEVTTAATSLVFIRGLIASGVRPILNFSAVIKKVRPR